MDILRLSDVSLPKFKRKRFCRLTKLVLRHSPHFDECFGAYFTKNLHIVPKLHAQTFFCGLWKRFYSILRTFWALWWLFCIHKTHGCLDTDGNVFLRVFKQVLRHSLQFFWALWWLLCVFRTYRWIDTGVNVSLRAFKSILQHSPHFFEHLRGYFASIGYTIGKYGCKPFFTCLETGFTALAKFFWALWWLLCVSQMYPGQNTSRNISSPSLKLVL